MSDLSTLLKDADPVARGESLSPDDALRMRGEMLAALPERVVVQPVWKRPLTLAAAAALVMTAITVTGHRTRLAQPSADLPESVTIAPESGGSSGAMAKRQLQFATPGGTRIIWIFDENLRLQESLP